MTTRSLALLAAALWLTAAAGQTPAPPAPDPNLAAINPSRGALALGEGVLAEEFLHDPAKAAEWYQVTINDPNTPRSQRQEARWRLARCYRHLSRPGDARALLNALLTDPTLSSAARRSAARELTLIPRAEPARLMAVDTLIYLEVPQPGIVLDRTLRFARASGLSDAVSLSDLGLPREAAMLDLASFWNPSMQRELSKLDALGMGWANFRFRQVGEHIEARSDLLAVLHTGGSVATAGVLEGLVTGLLTPQTQAEDLSFFAPAGLAEGPHFTVADGLFIMCSEEADGVAAVARHRGLTNAPTLFNTPRFRGRPAGWPQPDAVFLYVDWNILLERFRVSLPDRERADVDRVTEWFSLRRAGPIYASAALREGAFELDAAIAVDPNAGQLLPLWRTPPIAADWQGWLPPRATFVSLTTIADGARQWLALEALWAAAVDWARTSDDPNATTQPSTAAAPRGWLATLRNFEKQAGISIAEDLCADVRAFLIAEMPAGESELGPAGQWVIVLELADADAWVAKVELAAGRWLLGDVPDARLPSRAVDTPQGPVHVATLPGTRLGLAWHVRDRRVALSLSPDTLVGFLAAISVTGGTEVADADLAGASKLLRLRLNQWWPSVGPQPRDLPPLTVATFEQGDALRVRLTQPRAADVVRELLALNAAASPTAPTAPAAPVPAGSNSP